MGGTEMSGRMFRLASDQPAKRGRLCISDLPRDMLERQAGGLKQKLRGLKPDPLHELNGRKAAQRDLVTGKCPIFGRSTKTA